MEFYLTDPQIWISLLTLTLLEIVLGIDNIIFLSIVTERLPEGSRRTAQRVGIGLALLMRLALLAAVVWIIGLREPLFRVFDHSVSWRDLILIAGGLFLLWKGTIEIHRTVEGEKHETVAGAPSTGFAAAVGQIVVIDVVFAFDSIITAVGMTQHLPVMYAAVITAMAVMLWASGPVSAFITRHPTVKMLALSFLLLIGVALVADGLHFHIPKGYLYFAVAFSVLVEGLNLMTKRRRRRRANPHG